MKRSFDLSKSFRLLVPKPAIFITTADSNGKANVATAAYVMFVSTIPPIIGISLGNHRSLRNITATGEFAINIPSKSMAQESWIIGELFADKPIPYDTNKFGLGNLTPIPAKVIRVPLVKECFAHLECKSLRIETLHNIKLVLGEVVAASGDSEKFDRDANIRPEHLSPLMIVSGSVCASTGKMFQIDTKKAGMIALRNAERVNRATPRPGRPIGDLGERRARRSHVAG